MSTFILREGLTGHHVGQPHLTGLWMGEEEGETTEIASAGIEPTTALVLRIFKVTAKQSVASICFFNLRICTLIYDILLIFFYSWQVKQFCDEKIHR